MKRSEAHARRDAALLLQRRPAEFDAALEADRA